MPVSNKGGASNAWLEREPDYVAPQQDEEVAEVVETAGEPEPEVQVKRPRKRPARGGKDA